MKLFISIYISRFLYRMPQYELGPDCSLDEFSRGEALFVLEAGRNNLNSTWGSVDFFRVVWKYVSNL